MVYNCKVSLATPSFHGFQLPIGLWIRTKIFNRLKIILHHTYVQYVGISIFALPTVKMSTKSAAMRAFPKPTHWIRIKFNELTITGKRRTEEGGLALSLPAGQTHLARWHWPSSHSCLCLLSTNAAVAALCQLTVNNKNEQRWKRPNWQVGLRRALCEQDVLEDSFFWLGRQWRGKKTTTYGDHSAFWANKCFLFAWD